MSAIRRLRSCNCPAAAAGTSSTRAESQLRVTIHAPDDPAVLSAQLGANPDAAGEAGHRASQALAELAASGISLGEFALGQPTLDDTFLALTAVDSAIPDAEEAR